MLLAVFSHLSLSFEVFHISTFIIFCLFPYTNDQISNRFHFNAKGQLISIFVKAMKKDTCEPPAPVRLGVGNLPKPAPTSCAVCLVQLTLES